MTGDAHTRMNVAANVASIVACLMACMIIAPWMMMVEPVIVF